jgi:hypothetical protein
MKMETKLNDNEVREIAQMQMKIDTYESFIGTLCATVVSGRTDLNYLLFDGTQLTKEMNAIWRFVKRAIKDYKDMKIDHTQE